MSQDLNWNEVALAIHDDNLTLHGKRVAILRDPSPETFGNSKILVPESSKVVKPLSGVIVAIGDKVTEEDSILDIGMRVNFNKFNVIGFMLELSKYENPIELDVLHVTDIYWDSGVDECVTA